MFSIGLLRYNEKAASVSISIDSGISLISTVVRNDVFRLAGTLNRLYSLLLPSGSTSVICLRSAECFACDDD